MPLPPAPDVRPRKPGMLSSLLLPFLVTTISLAITGELWLNEKQNAIQNLQRIFDHRMQDYQLRIEQHLKDYEHLLRGMEGLFAAREEVSRGEFREFVAHQQIGRNFPGIQGIGYAQFTSAPGKRQLTAFIRKQGFSDFAIWPEERTAGAAPVVFIEPFLGGNQQAFGFDGLSEPVRRSAMEQARDTGEISLSSRIPPLPGQGEHPYTDFRMYLAVYRNGVRPSSPAERRAAIAGWLYLPFRMEDFMNEALGNHKGRLDTEIYDGNNSSRETLVYDSDSSKAHIAKESSALFKGVLPMDFFGRHWILAAHSLPDFDMRMDTGRHHIILKAGTGVSILLGLLTWLLLRSRSQAIRHADELGRELTERKQAEAGLRLTASVIHAMEEAVIVTDRDNNIISVNPAFSAITGYAPEEVIGRNPRIFASGRHPPEFFREMWDILLRSGSWHGEIWDRLKNGELHVKWLSLRLIRDENGYVANHVAVFSDISERKRAEEHLQQLAHHDALTGLPNRVLFADRFSQALTKARRNNGRAALLYIDLDKFKPVNDTAGHAVGDLLLKEAAERMQSCLRESDTVSRKGGDEFVVLLSAIENEANALLVAEKILSALNRPFCIDGRQLSISASLGIATYPEHGDNEASLERSADAAMYRAKQAGGNTIHLHLASES